MLHRAGILASTPPQAAGGVTTFNVAYDATVGTTGTIANLVVPLSITDPALRDVANGGVARTDAHDIRLFESDGSTPLPFYRAHYDPVAGTWHGRIVRNVDAADPVYNFQLHVGDPSWTTDVSNSVAVYGGSDGAYAVRPSVLGELSGNAADVTVQGSAATLSEVAAPFGIATQKTTTSTDCMLTNATQQFQNHTWYVMARVDGTPGGDQFITGFSGTWDGCVARDNGGPIARLVANSSTDSTTQFTFGQWHCIVINCDWNNEYHHHSIDGAAYSPGAGAAPGLTVSRWHIAVGNAGAFLDGAIGETLRYNNAPLSDQATWDRGATMAAHYRDPTAALTVT